LNDFPLSAELLTTARFLVRDEAEAQDLVQRCVTSS
jgi:hypothetical protein